MTTVAGSTTTFGTGTYTMALPVTADNNATFKPSGVGHSIDSGGTEYPVILDARTTTTCSAFVAHATGSGQVSQTNPITFGNADTIWRGTIYYEAA